MIHIFNPKDRINQYSKYVSKNRKHRFDVLFSLLFKSLRANDEYHALYAYSQIRYPNVLKYILIIYCCENCPIIDLVAEIYITPLEREDAFRDFIIKLCRMTKTRTHVNALRIATSEYYKEHITNDKTNKMFETYLLHKPSKRITINDLVIEQTDNFKTLIINAHIMFQLYSENGIKQTNKDVFQFISTHMTKFQSYTLSNVFKYIDNHYLDIVLLLLSFTSLATYNQQYEQITTPNPPSIDIPELIPLNKFPVHVFDMTLSQITLMITKHLSQNTYEYYLQNIESTTKPILRQKQIDTLAVSKFITIKEPIEKAIIEHVPKCEVIKNIKLARMNTPDSVFSLASTHQKHIKYKYIIRTVAIRNKQLMRDYVLADALKQYLNLPHLHRHIIQHDGKYYLFQDNIYVFAQTLDMDELNANESEYFARDVRTKRTIFTFKINCFYPNEACLYTDNDELTLKIFKLILFQRMIGTSTHNRKYNIVIYNDEVYSFIDRYESKYYSNTMFGGSITTQADVSMKLILNKHWKDLQKTIDKWSKQIAMCPFINANCRIRMIYELHRFKDKNNWVFVDVCM